MTGLLRCCSLNGVLWCQARKGFQAYVRAYATHSKETKHIFHVRSLHFGHVARSFALKEPPTKVQATLKPSKARSAKTKGRGGRAAKGARQKGGGALPTRLMPTAAQMRANVVSEFAA